jgi:hypothetical protein
VKKYVGLLSIVAGFAIAIACGIALTASTRAGATAQIAYVPIDPRVFVTRKVAAEWAQQHNEAAVRAHAVALFAGLTARTAQQFRGTKLAVFDTWFTPCEIYPVTDRCGLGEIHFPTTLVLEPPLQFIHTPRVSGNDILSSVRYNEEMKDFVDDGFEGSPYTTGAGLVKAIAAEQRDLVDTALPAAMALKPTYELFSLTKPTIVMYWQGPGLSVHLGASTSLVPDATTWLKPAIVDPTGKATNTKPLRFCANTVDPFGAVVSHKFYTVPGGSYPVIPLREFYTIPLDTTEMALIAQNRRTFAQRQYAALSERFGAHSAAAAAAAGCPSVTPVNPAAALVGLHVVSAELLDVWTWQTFWWTPRVKPLPGTQGPFRHFDVATAYWTIDKPPNGFRYAFNPYLEGGFGTDTFLTPAFPTQGQPGSVINLGRTTNCISCHQIATYTLTRATPRPGYAAHGNQPQRPVSNSILTRNLWSLAIRAGKPASVP